MLHHSLWVNLSALMDDKWFGGTRPDYLQVSLNAIANTVADRLVDTFSTSRAGQAMQRGLTGVGEQIRGDGLDASGFNRNGLNVRLLNERIGEGFNQAVEQMFARYDAEDVDLKNWEKGLDLDNLPLLADNRRQYPSIFEQLARENSSRWNYTDTNILNDWTPRPRRPTSPTHAERVEKNISFNGDVLDGAAYVAKASGLTILDALSFGLYSRSDQRKLEVRAGSLNPNDALMADLIESGAGLGLTLITGGTANLGAKIGSGAAVRLGAGQSGRNMAAVAGAGSIGTATIDLGAQLSENASSLATDGATGKVGLDVGRLVLNASLGLTIGGALAARGTRFDPVFLRPLIAFDTSFGRLNSGLPIEVQNPFRAAGAAIITESRVLSTGGIDEQVAHAVRMVPGLEEGQARALLQAAFNPNKPVEVVLGGSRIRSFFGQGTFRLDSDLDIGFAAKMKNHQIDNILDSFDASGVLKSERQIKIFSGNKPLSGPIVSPQEFFQRSGFRGPLPPERAGEPFAPSGYISFHPNGTITIVPPGK